MVFVGGDVRGLGDVVVRRVVGRLRRFRVFAVGGEAFRGAWGGVEGAAEGGVGWDGGGDGVGVWEGVGLMARGAGGEAEEGEAAWHTAAHRCCGGCEWVVGSVRSCWRLMS